ncbi:MAG TPA: DUF222 domain-containing protein [Mycobacteriales bacterium]|nr:DUF222 domain-containing protein [Mycobacteriales bacterium]
MQAQLNRLHRKTAERVEVAASMKVGPALVAELSRLNTEPMTAETAVTVAALWAKVAAWVSAQQMVPTYEALHGIRGALNLDPRHEGLMLTAQELACETHVAYPTAMSQVALVERIAECLPASWEAMARGEISLAHVKAVEKATTNCSPRVAEAVDCQVVALAVERGWTPGETARAARRLVIAMDPDGAVDRAAAAKDCADVRFYPLPDETATLVATGDAVLARRMADAVDELAEAMARAGDDRNVGVRRFHALADLVLNEPGAGIADGRPVPRGETHVRVDLTTMLGQDDRPGELVGYGPITAQTARRIAADTMLRRLVFDPLTGDTLDLGRRSYRPSAALRRLIVADKPTCGMPGCSRPSIDCEIDHRREYDRRTDPGRTDRDNLGPKCKLHHDLKTKKLWHVDVNPDGTETWISFLGHRYTKHPTWFPVPEPLVVEPEPPEEIADGLPLFADPDPPDPDEPLPAPPALTDAEYEEMARAVDLLDAFGETFRQWCDRHYDEARVTGLVA